MSNENYFQILFSSVKILYNRTYLFSVERVKHDFQVFDGNITNIDAIALVFWMIVIFLSRNACYKLFMVITILVNNTNFLRLIEEYIISLTPPLTLTQPQAIEPQPIGPQHKGDQLMGSQPREAYRMRPLPIDLYPMGPQSIIPQPSDISLYESLVIVFYEALFLFGLYSYNLNSLYVSVGDVIRIVTKRYANAFGDQQSIS